MIEMVGLPDNFKPEGLIKIELFDDLTKKKVEEIHAHNFISKGVRDVLFKLKAMSTFTRNRPKNGNDADIHFPDFFAQMSLTDASHPEDADKEWLRFGKLIGYALSDTTDGSSDALRGSYNPIESYTGHDMVRMVFDFDSSRSNDTFRSIYFHPKGTISFASNPYFKSVLTFNDRYVQKYKENYYVLSQSMKDLSVYDLEFKLLENYALPYDSIRDFVIVDDEIYYARDYSTNTIMKAPVSSPSSLENALNIADSNYVGGITFDTKNQQFIVGDYTSSKKRFIYYDRSFNRVKDTPVNITPGYTDGPLTLVDNGFICSAFLVDFFGNEKQISYYPIQYVGDDFLINNGKIVPKLFIGSRSLLPSPVTKKEGQTMKITYDFVMPPLY